MSVVESKRRVPALEKRPSWARGLTDREFLFVMAYGRHWNATDAAKQAGHSKVSAGNAGHKLMNSPRIREAIHEMTNELLPLIKTSLAERLMSMVNANISDYISWDGTGTRAQVNIKSSKTLTAAQKACIKSVKKRVSANGSTIELTLHDPLAAAEQLSKLLGLVKPDGELGPRSGGNVTVIIEGLVPKDDAATTIDITAIQQHIKAAAFEEPEEKPPGF